MLFNSYVFIFVFLPVEMTTAPEVDAKMAALGFKVERVFARPVGSGLLGSGCHEYVYRRQQ